MVIILIGLLIIMVITQLGLVGDNLIQMINSNQLSLRKTLLATILIFLSIEVRFHIRLSTKPHSMVFAKRCKKE